ncbi:MAG: isopentenyl-diphosphate Delta-isomerase [Clostridiales bacterium]|nr:isopentenyl-diphosphate Delta-isomerase [Clostridiales bacterium]
MADVILVDIFDNDIGIAEKIQAHENAMLHRAFSLFVVHNGNMLIQQRAYTKYHSPGKWANACCSHPWRGKTLEECAMQRAKEELGIEISKPKELFDFIYFSEYDNGLCEYELDHVLIVDYDGSLSINREEINDVKWINIDDLSIDIVKYPQKYTTWFLNCVPRVIKYIKENF